MWRKIGVTLAVLVAGIHLLGCDSGSVQGDSGGKDYAGRVAQAKALTEKAKKLYYDGMGFEPGRERNAKLKQAYKLADRAMQILNKLEDEFGHRKVPRGEVLIHKPVLQECTKVIFDIQKMMPAVE